MSAPLRALLLAGLVLALDAHAQQDAPDWGQTAPATIQRAPSAQPAAPMQQQQRSQRVQRQQQALPPADTATFQSQATAVPEGYQVMRVPPPPASSGRDERMQSQLPESNRTYEQQLDILRKRVATLVQQMDDMQVRMLVTEQGLAQHSHAYSIPNMGFISVESYNHYLERQQRIGEPVPFFHGYANRTTTPPVMPR